MPNDLLYCWPSLPNKLEKLRSGLRIWMRCLPYSAIYTFLFSGWTAIPIGQTNCGWPLCPLLWWTVRPVRTFECDNFACQPPWTKNMIMYFTQILNVYVIQSSTYWGTPIPLPLCPLAAGYFTKFPNLSFHFLTIVRVHGLTCIIQVQVGGLINALFLPVMNDNWG